MKLSWNSITVAQFQDIYNLSLNTSLDDITKSERVIAVIYNKTEKEVEELPMSDFARMARQTSFLMSGEIPGRPKNVIKTKKAKYRIVYNVAKLRHRQYVEVLHFGDKPIENMHLVMASVVEPITWYGKVKKNDVKKHEEIASDLQTARVIDVYHSCVFFCKLYEALTSVIKDYSKTRKAMMN